MSAVSGITLTTQIVMKITRKPVSFFVGSKTT
jgi:hypothetical protein